MWGIVSVCMMCFFLCVCVYAGVLSCFSLSYSMYVCMLFLCVVMVVCTEKVLLYGTYVYFCLSVRGISCDKNKNKKHTHIKQTKKQNTA